MDLISNDLTITKLQNGTSGANYATVYLYRRGSSAPAKPNGDVIYTFSTGAVTGSLNSWTRQIPTGTNPCWMIVAQAVASAGNDTDTITKDEWSAATKVVQNGTNGTNGLNSATIYLYKRISSGGSIAGPGSVITYTFADGSITGIDLNGWTKEVPDVNANHDPCYVISASAISSRETIDIATTSWSEAVKLVEDGQNGQDGITVVSTSIKYGISSNSITEPSGWYDTESEANPQPGDYLWIKTIVIYSDTTKNTTSYSVSRIGENGQNGQDGHDGQDGTSVSILNQSVSYKKSDNSTTIPGEPWSPTVSGAGAGPGDYLWTRTIVNYTIDGTTVLNSTTSYSVSRMGEDGEDGQDASKYFITYNQQDIYRFYQLNSDSNYDYVFSPQDLKIYLKNNENNILTNISPVDITSFNLKINLGNYNIKFTINGIGSTTYTTEIPQGESNFNNILNLISETNNNVTTYFGYLFKIQDLYNRLKTIRDSIPVEPETESQIEKLNEVLRVLQSGFVNIESQIEYNETNEAIYYPYSVVLIKSGIDENMLRFTETAANITAAISDSKLVFDVNGLTIQNGAFTIIDTNKLSDDKRIFYYDERNHQLYVEGNGSFTGIISAREGSIGGFIIDDHSIFSVTDGIQDHRITLDTGLDGNGSFLEVEDLRIGSSSSFSTNGALKIGDILTIRAPGNENAQDKGILDVSTGINENENIYFRIMPNGNIIGKNWNIDENGTATFNNGIFNNGIFNGTVYATAGEFTGKIKSSEFESGYITATTLDVVEFITQKARSMGGAFIFKTTLNIKNIENYGNNDHQVKIIFDSNDYAEYIADLDITNYRVVLSNNQGIQFGTINSKDSDYVIVNCDGSRSNVANSITITLLGQDGHKLFAINSDDGNYGGILPERSLSIQEYNTIQYQSVNIDINNFNKNKNKYYIYDTENNKYIQCENNDIFDSTETYYIFLGPYSKKLILGDLTSIGYSGYGLYADNVYLKGSLATEQTDNENNKSYAGISTRTQIMKENERVMFWAGAKNEDDIINSPFIVTEKGSIYASKGIFSGSIISESIISRSTIEAATILGTEDEGPSLKIFNTQFNSDKKNGGIGFYRREIIDDQEVDELTLRITDIGLFYKDNSFIKFDNNDVIFKLDSTEFSKQIIKDQVGNDGKIAQLSLNGLKENGYSKLSYNENYINITDTLIENYSNQTVINKELIVKENENLKLDYRINGSYYCLFVN